MDQSKGGLTMGLMEFNFSGFLLAWAPSKTLYSYFGGYLFAFFILKRALKVV